MGHTYCGREINNEYMRLSCVVYAYEGLSVDPPSPSGVIDNYTNALLSMALTVE